MGVLDKNNYHFIGIGGIGISAIARMLISTGKKVSGSDSSESEITSELGKLGAKIFIGQKAENIPDQTKVVIYTIAIPENNPEMQEVRKIEALGKIVCVSYPEALGELSKTKYTIAVAGTHGKTTTTAMIGHIMQKAGLDPTIIVGSKILSNSEKSGTNFLAGKSEYLVVEACEYKRSFLNLHPQILVITNIEQDHLDYYKDLGDIKSAFEELKQKVPRDSFIITETEYSKVSRGFELLTPGEHNIKNAQAAIAAVEKLGITEEKAREFLKDFRGTWRRLEYKGEKLARRGGGDVVFYDDYAHHPSAIRASLTALRQKYPDRKLAVVFEPHQQKRTKDFFDDFVDSLSLADQVFIAPIYAAREAPDPSISNKILAEAISKKMNKKVSAMAVDSVEELREKLFEITHPLLPETSSSLFYSQERDPNLKFCVCLMGAGDIYKWTSHLLSP